MYRKETEWLIDYIFEDCQDLWRPEEIAKNNYCKTDEGKINVLRDMSRRLPDAPCKNDMNNPRILREVDLKKAIGALLTRMRAST